MRELASYVDGVLEGSPLSLELVSFPSVFEAIQSGVDAAMLVSTLSAIPAFVLLGVMLRNLRFLLITMINIFFCVTASIVVMYPIAASTKVPPPTPPPTPTHPPLPPRFSPTPRARARLAGVAPTQRVRNKKDRQGSPLTRTALTATV